MTDGPRPPRICLLSAAAAVAVVASGQAVRVFGQRGEKPKPKPPAPVVDDVVNGEG